MLPRVHTRRLNVRAFPRDDDSLRSQAAELLVEAFPHENGWPTLALALEEVDEALAPGRCCRAAIDDDGQLLGWIAAMPGYRGRVWELHPLVVRANARGNGIGRELTRDLEGALAAKGALTLWVGTDDDSATRSSYWSTTAMRRLGGFRRPMAVRISWCRRPMGPSPRCSWMA